MKSGTAHGGKLEQVGRCRKRVIGSQDHRDLLISWENHESEPLETRSHGAERQCNRCHSRSDPQEARRRSAGGQFINLSGREGEAPAEPHAREQGSLKVAAQPELRPPNCTNFRVGPSDQPCRSPQCQSEFFTYREECRRSRGTADSSHSPRTAARPGLRAARCD